MNMAHTFRLMGVSCIAKQKELWFVRGRGRIEIGLRISTQSYAVPRGPWTLCSPERDERPRNLPRLATMCDTWDTCIWRRYLL